MSESKLDLILHPIRLRILITLGDQQMTPQQIARALPDVAQATLYRHINALTEGELLSVIEENAIRGTVEKVYALSNPAALMITQEELAGLSKEQHMHYFTIFAISLVNYFAQYLQASNTVDFVRDSVGYHTHRLYMSNDEVMQFSRGLYELAKPYLTKNDDKRRTARLFSTILMPSEPTDEQD